VPLILEVSLPIEANQEGASKTVVKRQVLVVVLLLRFRLYVHDLFAGLTPSRSAFITWCQLNADAIEWNRTDGSEYLK